MNRINNSYKLTSLILLTIIISHLFVFHFELEEKILCIGDGDHFQIENVSGSHFGNQFNLKSLDNRATIGDNDNCTDYLLDFHVDEDFVKIRKNILQKFVQVIDINNQELSKIINSNNIYYNRFIAQKYITEQLPTVLLLI